MEFIMRSRPASLPEPQAGFPARRDEVEVEVEVKVVPAESQSARFVTPMDGESILMGAKWSLLCQRHDELEARAGFHLDSSAWTRQ